MTRFLIRRIISGIVILFSVITLVFFLFSVSFPSPENMAVGQRTDEATQEAIKKEFGLDRSLGWQYLYFLNDLSPVSLHATDTKPLEKYSVLFSTRIGKQTLAVKTPFLRRSFQSRERTEIILAEAFKGTFILALVSIIFASFIGISLGVLAGVKAHSHLDRLILFVSTLGISVPSFFSAIVLAWFFGFVLHDFTGLNMTGSWTDTDPFTGTFYDWKNLILPALALGVRPLSIFILLTRSSILETLTKDYIKTAVSKGFKPFYIMRKHALPNALNPVITAISGWFASLLAGAFFVEYIFNWRGLGRVTIEALEMCDLPVVMGAILFIALIFICMNILVDIIYVKLDPRVRLES